MGASAVLPNAQLRPVSPNDLIAEVVCRVAIAFPFQGLVSILLLPAQITVYPWQRMGLPNSYCHTDSKRCGSKQLWIKKRPSTLKTFGLKTYTSGCSVRPKFNKHYFIFKQHFDALVMQI